MVLFREYNPDTRIDKVWYDAGNVFYTECEDIKDSLKVLTVVFNNGATYKYSDVDVNDYVMFVAGGLDGSNGKAFHKFIISKKYPFVRLEDRNKDELLKEMEELKKQKEDKK